MEWSLSFAQVNNSAKLRALSKIEHPDTVLLTGIDGRDAVLAAERLEVEVGESLVRAVVPWPYKTVELAVVEAGEPVLELL